MSLPTARQDTWRFVLLVLVTAIYYWLICWYPEWMNLLGLDYAGLWFVDTHALLAASDAHVMGIDPSAHNPLDFFRQPHVYSSWWFGLHSIGLTRTDHIWLGAVQGFAFLAVALLHLRARSRGEWLLSFVTLAAPSLVLGFTHGNADLLVFVVLGATVPCLCSRYSVVRWLSIGAILIAAGLKFYPAVAGLVLLAPTRSRQERFGQLALCCVLLIWLGIHQAPDLHRYATLPGRPSGVFTFGAESVGLSLSAPQWATTFLPWVIGGGVAIFWWRVVPAFPVPLERRSEYLQFILGAVVLTSCYFATINYSYRYVFVLFMIRFIWWMWRAPDLPRWFRNLGRITGGLVIAVVWSDGIFCLILNALHVSQAKVDLWTERFNLPHQALIALLFVALLAFLVVFVREAVGALIGTRPQDLSVRPNEMSRPA